MSSESSNVSKKNGEGSKVIKDTKSDQKNVFCVEKPNRNNVSANKRSASVIELPLSKKCKPHSDEEHLDFIKEALKKVQELEHELLKYSDADDSDENEDESVNEFERNANAFDAEALGFAVCARETFQFLATEGFSASNPLIQSLRNRLIGPPRSASI